MRKLIVVIAVIALFLMAGCKPQVQTKSDQVIGGQKDEYGCLSAAGYTWCESKQKCLRTWEEECPLTQEQAHGPPAQEKAIAVVKAYVAGMDDFKRNQGRDVQVIKATQGACPGCWIMEVDYYFDSKEDPAKLDKATVQITMDAWEVINANYMTEQAETLTPKGCALQGGRVVNTATGQTCKTGETKIGDIKAFKSPHICCKTI